ncbi:acyltransferase [Verrucomicrobiota bacterium]
MKTKSGSKITKRFLSAKNSLNQLRLHCKLKISRLVYTGDFLVDENLLLNMPIRLEGSGSIKLGKSVSVGYGRAPKMGNGEILLQTRSDTASIEIGSGSVLSNNLSIICSESILIGERCLIGDFASIIDSDFHDINPSKRHTATGETKPVVLEENVWVGSRAMIMKGVTIGKKQRYRGWSGCHENDPT